MSWSYLYQIYSQKSKDLVFDIDEESPNQAKIGEQKTSKKPLSRNIFHHKPLIYRHITHKTLTLPGSPKAPNAFSFAGGVFVFGCEPFECIQKGEQTDTKQQIEQICSVWDTEFRPHRDHGVILPRLFTK